MTLSSGGANFSGKKIANIQPFLFFSMQKFAHHQACVYIFKLTYFFWLQACLINTKISESKWIKQKITASLIQDGFLYFYFFAWAPGIKFLNFNNMFETEFQIIERHHFWYVFHVPFAWNQTRALCQHQRSKNVHWA